MDMQQSPKWCRRSWGTFRE